MMSLIEAKGLSPGWWKGWRLWFGLAGFVVLFGGLGFMIALDWPNGMSFLIFLVGFSAWAITLVRTNPTRRRWDTDSGEYVLFDGDTGSDGDCGD